MRKMGLVNSGNTCFMNTGVQCLLATSELTKYFMNEAFYKSDLEYGA